MAYPSKETVLAHPKASPRALALAILEDVLKRNSNLDRTLRFKTTNINRRDAALIAELCFGVCRFYYELKDLALLLANTPPKDLDVELAILLGLYEMKHTRIPAYATVNEITTLIGQRRPAAKGMVNACLRQYDVMARKTTAPTPTELQARYAHPLWMIDKIKQNFSKNWQAILTANNSRPPFGLRVNPHRTTLADYAALLRKEGIAYRLPSPSALAPDALILEGRHQTEDLPRYKDGWICVQDVGAQLAARLLIPRQGESMLDACCAPGNKLSHSLSLVKASAIPAVHFYGLDKSPDRLEDTRLNLARQGFTEDQNLRLNAADLNDLATLRKHQFRYDKVLLDAPCSASGVIRRHPDIKLRLSRSKIADLVKKQANLLQSAWRCLRPGGLLLYISCSLFAEENEDLITAFLSDHGDAKGLVLPARLGSTAEISSRQAGMFYLRPARDHDGFFYARLVKLVAS